MSGRTVEVAGAAPVLRFLHTNVRHNLQVILVLFQVFLEIFLEVAQYLILKTMFKWVNSLSF